MPAILRKNKKDPSNNKSCPNSPAIDCTENVKFELNAAENNNAAESPLVQVKSLIEKKIRNLEKRKSKLEQTKMDFQAGKELVEDQLKALKQLDCVESQIELAKEFLKNVKQIMNEAEHTHQRNTATIKEHDADVAKIRQLLIMQEVLDCLGKDSIRQDFRTGSKGALKLSDKQFDLLDEAYLKLCPSREDLSDKNAWLALLQEAAKYSSSLLNKINQPVPGRDVTFAQLHSLIDDILESEYFVRGVQIEEVVVNGSATQTENGSSSTSGICIDSINNSEKSSSSASASASTTTTDLQSSPVIEENDSSSSQLAVLAQNGVGTSSSSHRASSSSLSSNSAMTTSAAEGPVSPPVAALPVHFVPQQAPITAYCAPEFLPPPPPNCSAPPPFVENVSYYSAPQAHVAAPSASLYEAHDGNIFPIQQTYTPAEFLNQPISVCPTGQEPMFIYDPNTGTPFVTVSTAPIYDDGNIYYNDYAPVEQAYFVPERDHVPSTHVFSNGLPPPALPTSHNLHHSSSKSLDPNAPAFVSRMNTNLLAQQETPNNTIESSQINKSNIIGEGQESNFRKEMDLNFGATKLDLDATKKSEKQIPQERIEENSTNGTDFCSAEERPVRLPPQDIKKCPKSKPNTNSLIHPQPLSKTYAFVPSHNDCDSSTVIST